MRFLPLLSSLVISYNYARGYRDQKCGYLILSTCISSSSWTGSMCNIVKQSEDMLDTDAPLLWTVTVGLA